MAKAFGVAAVLGVAALASVRSANALYGGVEAAAGEGASAVYFDWFNRRGSGSCSGVLVGPRAVLTAAHCVRSLSHGSHRVNSVRIGNPRGRTERVAVARMEVHPDFDVQHPEHGHDVAVLVLARAVTDRAPVRLAGPADDPSEQGTRVTIQGFGLTQRGRAIVRTRALRTASLEYLSPFHCFTGDVDAMARTRMCAATPNAGVCPGDSGSGATIVVGGQPVVIGVVSLAIDASTCVETATVLTRVSAMRAFIDGAVASPP